VGVQSNISMYDLQRIGDATGQRISPITKTESKMQGADRGVGAV
jgi:hypothetical protein